MVFLINAMKITRDDNVYISKRNFKVSVARVAQRQSNGVIIWRSWVQFPLLCPVLIFQLLQHLFGYAVLNTNRQDTPPLRNGICVISSECVRLVNLKM